MALDARKLKIESLPVSRRLLRTLMAPDSCVFGTPITEMPEFEEEEEKEKMPMAEEGLTLIPLSEDVEHPVPAEIFDLRQPPPVV
ncbi:hypothetical protein NDU88_003312 [Pleurodeles waltl]|uniref:Uncharacterized protein n=1 Tax=Pleurodeles waltl TaxID=8319 RepID=A0AAV7T500_PLEWA|nr:hypothetical protein NDU88_003312 [Pleurodeles waltl]